MSHSHKQIRVGPAGWSYKDWNGIVYPAKRDKQFKELDFLAGFFDTAEINSTFYRPANAFVGNAWVRKVSHNARFKFTAKLWQRFTHDRTDFGNDEIKQVTQGFDPLAQAGKLGAVLCQFPWSYKNTEDSRDWLLRILDTFKMYPLVVEVRHSSWDTPFFYDFLDAHNVGFATIDQPVIGNSITFKPIQTGSIGYVRMHGRNYKMWFQKKGEKMTAESRMARYDYLYSEKEIQQIAENVKTVAEGSQEVYVVQNNHPRGQAVANAMQLRAALGEEILKLPETMFEHFPQLKGIAQSL